MGAHYVPNYGDLDDFRYERLPRTKSRTYQLACWQGYLGTHEFFLGRSLRGWAVLLYSTASLGMFMYSWILGVLMVLGVAALNLVSVRAIAATDPESDIYGEPCGATFQSIQMITARGLLWDTNFWKGKEPTDGLEA